MPTPSVTDTIEWVRQFHFLVDSPTDCARCGGKWPCVPSRLSDEVERLWDLCRDVAKELDVLEVDTNDAADKLDALAKRLRPAEEPDDG